jgi:signal transduction histidine kinase
MHRALQPQGWSRVWRLGTGENSSGILTLGFYALSPFAILVNNKDVSWTTIGVFILVINVFSVLTLVPLLVKRIKRAEKAASAWTQGDLTARIGDTGDDEFGRLSERFDEMADALSGVIEVKLALAAAEERNRLARDLHDTAKQRAFALGLQLTALRRSSLKSAEAAKIASAAIAVVSNLQQDLADVIKRLSAPTIAEIGLRCALIEAIGALLNGSGVSWTLLFSQEDEIRLARAPEVARQLLLISSECCANVLKHANATQMNLAIRADGALFTLRIADDGQGFDPRRAEATGMGLSNMRLRANSLPSGTLNLITGVGNGTVITVTFRAPH